MIELFNAFGLYCIVISLILLLYDIRLRYESGEIWIPLIVSTFDTAGLISCCVCVISIDRFWRKQITLWFLGILSLKSQVNRFTEILISSIQGEILVVEWDLFHVCVCDVLGWRKISFYFNLSFEIKDKTIEFDENRNVLRAEFVVRAHMQYEFWILGAFAWR